MTSANRVMVNAIVMYVKIILSTIVGLYLTRVVLDVLGVSDFGIYNVIAGVIAILAFLESSLMTSSQRFFSVAIGESDVTKYVHFVSSSFIIHILFTVIIVSLLEVAGFFLFDGFLTIPANRLYVAKIVYQLMICSTAVTVVCIPFNALINAEEDIWFYGILQTVCTLLRLLIIFGFNVIDVDSLLLYSIWVASTTAMTGMGAAMWCFLKYSIVNKCNLSYQKNKLYIKDLFGFAGWNTLGSFAVIARNQGVAILLNHFFCPAINAVYGIANQVNGQLAAFANTLTASFTPQIAKSYGEGNNERLVFLSVFTSKMAFMLSAVMAIPFLLEMPLVLRVWLKEVPEFTEFYCGTIIYMFLLNEMYPGLVRGIQAVGNIRNREIVCSSVIILPILIGALLFSLGYNHTYIIYLIGASQLVLNIVNIYYAHKLYGLKFWHYIKECMKFTFVYFIVYFSGMFLKYIMDEVLTTHQLVQFLIICSYSIISFLVLFYIVSFDKHEKNVINCIVMNKIKNRISK